MRACRYSSRRRGATLVEFAFVAPVVFFFIFAQIVGGLGIFRYQEVANMARDGARYASIHGGLYQSEGTAQRTGVPAVANSSDLANYVKSRALLLNRDNIQVSVSWNPGSNMTPVNMPTYVDPNSNPPGQIVIQNNVIVTVNYQWFPEMHLVGPITLSSTSEMPMSY